MSESPVRSLLPLNGAQAKDCLHALILRLLARGATKEAIATLLKNLGVDPASYLGSAKRKFGMTSEQLVLAEEFISPALWKQVALQCSLNGSGSVEFVVAEDIEIKKLDWLWYARLLKRALALLEGPPDKGKSTQLCELAARESCGHSYPGQERGRAPGNVVMLTAEDDLEATVKPRLLAAGADLKKVHVLKLTRNEKGEIVPFQISDDCDHLRKKCIEVGATMVSIDPLVSYLGSRRKRDVDTSNDMQVRKSLTPLKELAEDVGASIIAVRHYKKGRGTDAIEAGGGSIAFAGLARVLLAALADPDNSDQYLFAVAKNNLVPKNKRPALSYKIVPSDFDPEIGRILWGEEVEMSAEEILTAASEQKKDSSSVSDAKAFLREALASGEWVPSKDVAEAAKEKGLTVRVLGIARKRMGIEVQKKDKWFWRLPQKNQAKNTNQDELF